MSYIDQMSDLSAFGARLARLLEHRATPASAVAKAAGVPAVQLDAVLTGGEPDDPLLRRLAPAVGLHASDLFLFAARTVPDDLAPAQLDGPGDVGGLLSWPAHRMSEPERARLRRFVDELTAHTVVRTWPFPSDGHEATPGVILRRLLNNRNIRLDARTLMMLGGGPYLSTSTYAMACEGRIPLRDEYVNAFARTVGLPVGDLAALLGIEVEAVLWGLKYPWPSDLVELAWVARRLDDGQLRAANDYVDDLRRGTA